MLVYVILIIFLFTFSFKIVGLSDNRKIGIFFFILWGVASFRAITIGNDTATYFHLFQLAQSDNFLEVYSGRYEYGYLLVNKIIAHITNNFTVFLMIINAFVYWAYYKYVKENSKNKMLSIIIFFLAGFFGQTMNIIRLQIAMAFTLLSYTVKQKGYLRCSIILALLAVSFQRISVVYLITYFVPKQINIKFISIGFILSVGALFSLDKIFLLISDIVPYYRIYLLQRTYGIGEIKLASILQLIMQLGVLIFCLYEFNKKKHILSVENIQLLISQLYMMFISCLIIMISINYNLLDRCANIFWVYSLLLIPNIIKIIKKENKAVCNLLIISIFLIYFFTIVIIKSEWNNIYPYHTIFYIG